MLKDFEGDKMNFSFFEVKDGEMLEKVFAFRYNVIRDTPVYKDYFRETSFLNYKERDIYDPFSVHFAAIDEKNNICATVRLIHNSPHGYPTENGMIFDRSMFEREHLGEISRIFIDAKHRNLRSTKVIIQELKKLLYDRMTALDIEYSYGALEAHFIRLLKMYKMRYEVIGEKQLQGKMGLRLPCILYTKQLGIDNPELISF